MENNEIKIKCYDYGDQYMLVLLCLFGWGFIIAFLVTDSTNWYIYTASGLAFILLIVGIMAIARLKCKTYDIYSSKGIRRIMKGEEVFNIEWDEIEGLCYYPFWSFIFIRPCVLEIYLKQPPKMEKIVYWSSDNTKMISTPMSKRTLKKLAQFIPPHLLKDLKLKPSDQTQQTTDKR